MKPVERPARTDRRLSAVGFVRIDRISRTLLVIGAEALWIGHSGGVPGAQAVVAYAPAQQAIVAVALTGEGSAEATAHHLLRALQSHE